MNALQVDTPTLGFSSKRLTVGAFVGRVVVLEKDWDVRYEPKTKQSFLNPCALSCSDLERSHRHAFAQVRFGRRQKPHASAFKSFRKSTGLNMLVRKKRRSVSGELI